MCFQEASEPSFKEYVKKLVENTKACRDKLLSFGARVSETEVHLFLLNVLDTFGITGLDAQKKLEEIGITTNKNMIPGDTLKPNKTSGLRIGFAAVTTRGCTKEDAETIGELIYQYLGNKISTDEAKAKVSKLVKNWKNIEEI